MAKIDINKRYRTRRGDDVTIYSTTAKDEFYTVHGCVDRNSMDEIATWTKDGSYHNGLIESSYDLVEDTKEVWCNIWMNKKTHNVYVGNKFDTEKDAIRATFIRPLMLGPVVFLKRIRVDIPQEN